MKEYFGKFITGKVGVYRSFFLHFVLVCVLGTLLLLGMDILFPKQLPVLPSLVVLIVFLGIAGVGTARSAFRTLRSAEERVVHRISSGLVLILIAIFGFYTVVDVVHLL